MAAVAHSTRIQGKGMGEIVVPHKGKQVAFALPVQGPNSYEVVGRNILYLGLNVPTGDQVASLLHSVYDDKSVEGKPEIRGVRELIDSKGLWTYSNGFWVPGKGVYVIKDPRVLGKVRKLSQNFLEKVLKGSTELGWGGVRVSQDETLSFAPHGSYQVRCKIPSEAVEKDGFMLATFGIEGARKLAELVGQNKTMRVHGPFVEEIPGPELSYIKVRKDEVVGGAWNDSYNESYALGVLNKRGK